MNQSVDHRLPDQPVDNSTPWGKGNESSHMHGLLSNVSKWLASGDMYSRHVLSKQTDISLIDLRRCHSAPRPVEKETFVNSGSSRDTNDNASAQKKRKKYRSFAQVEKGIEMQRSLETYDESSYQKYNSECGSEAVPRQAPSISYELGDCTVTQCASKYRSTDNETKVKQERGQLGDCTVYEIDSSVGSFEHSGSVELVAENCDNPSLRTPEQSNHYPPFFHNLDSFGSLGKKRMVSKDFKCGICGKALGSESSLRVHTLNHSGVRPFQCNIEGCSKSFSQYGNLQTHIRSHLGIKPYVCKTCGASFVQLANLQAHNRKHTGDKPYSCQYCNGTFAHLSSLHSHVVWHHSGKMDFECTLCGRQFRSKNILTKHVIKVHDGKLPVT